MRATLASFPEAGIGIVATVPAADGIDIVASAIAIFAADRRDCEFAITVASEYGGAGLATALMTRSSTRPGSRGMKEMEGFVLKQNQAMLGLAKRLGFGIERDPEDASIRVCRMTLAE